MPAVIIAFSFKTPKSMNFNRNPNSNARRKVDGRVEAQLIRITCGPAPEGRARWTMRLLAKQVSLELKEARNTLYPETRELAEYSGNQTECHD